MAGMLGEEAEDDEFALGSAAFSGKWAVALELVKQGDQGCH